MSEPIWRIPEGAPRKRKRSPREDEEICFHKKLSIRIDGKLEAICMMSVSDENPVCIRNSVRWELIDSVWHLQTKQLKQWLVDILMNMIVDMVWPCTYTSFDTQNKNDIFENRLVITVIIHFYTSKYKNKCMNISNEHI